MSWRRLAVLVKYLPAESSTATAVLGANARWSETDHLLAMVVDRLSTANWQRGGDTKKQPPKPLPRPGGGRNRSRLSADQMQKRLLEQRRRCSRSPSN